MAKKIEISNNYCTVTDTDTSQVMFETTTTDVRYTRRTNTVVLFPNNERTYYSTLEVNTDNFVDSGDAPIEDIYDWLQTNTGA